MRLHRNQEAELELRKSIALLRQSQPIQPATLLHALQMLGWTLQRLNDPKKKAEIKGLLEEALKVSRANPNVHRHRKAFALMDIGRYRLLEGDGVTTAPLFAEAAELWRNDPDDPDRADLAEALAFQSAALRLAGKTREADAVKREAEERMRRHTDDQSTAARRTRAVLAGKMPPWP